MTKNAMVFTGVVYRDGQALGALCPELDVATFWKTVSEAKLMLKEAVTDYLEICIESNLPYLRPMAPDEDPRQTQPDLVEAEFRLKAVSDDRG